MKDLEFAIRKALELPAWGYGIDCSVQIRLVAPEAWIERAIELLEAQHDELGTTRHEITIQLDTTLRTEE